MYFLMTYISYKFCQLKKRNKTATKKKGSLQRAREGSVVKMCHNPLYTPTFCKEQYSGKREDRKENIYNSE